MNNEKNANNLYEKWMKMVEKNDFFFFRSFQSETKQKPYNIFAVTYNTPTGKCHGY